MTRPTTDDLAIVAMYHHVYFILSPPLTNIPEVLTQLEFCRLFFIEKGNFYAATHPRLSQILLEELSPKLKDLIEKYMHFPIMPAAIALQDIATVEKILDENATLFATHRFFFSRHSRFFGGLALAVGCGLGAALSGAPMPSIVVCMVVTFMMGFGICDPVPTQTICQTGKTKCLLENFKDLLEGIPESNALPAPTPSLVT